VVSLISKIFCSLWIFVFPKLSPFLRRIVATSCTLLGFIFSCVAVSSCAFVGRKSDGISSFYNDDYYYGHLTESDFDVRFGMWKFETEATGCVDYDDYSYLVEVDAAVEAARAFGVMSAIFGGIVLVTMFIGLFLVYPMVLWRVIMSFLFVIAILQLLTLSFFGSDLCTNSTYEDDDYSLNVDTYYDDCLPDEGAGCAIVAFISWIVAGIFTCLLPTEMISIMQLCNEGGCCRYCDNCECCDDSQRSGQTVDNQTSINTSDVIVIDPAMVTVVKP